MPQLDDQLIRLAEQRPPGGAGALIQRIENRMAEVPRRRSTPALHPVRAMVLAATAMLVFVGGVAVGHWAFGSVGLFDAAFGEPGRRLTTADINVLALMVAGLSGGSILLVGGLSLAWRWRHHRRIYRSSIDRGGIMETIEATTQRFDSTERVLRINRWTAVGLVLVLAALAALGGWLLVDNLATSDMEQMVLDSTAALNAGDRTAWIATHSDDAVLTILAGGEPGQVEGTQELFAWAQDAGASGFHADVTGDLLVSGDYVMAPMTISWRGAVGEVRYEGIHVFRFSDGQIIESVFMGERSAS